jgi:hypothetical protein
MTLRDIQRWAVLAEAPFIQKLEPSESLAGGREADD